jgi:hypothetical protein
MAVTEFSRELARRTHELDGAMEKLFGTASTLQPLRGFADLKQPA